MSNKMPLLESTDRFVKPADWSNTLIIACQHLLESNFLYFEKLVASGLSPKNLFMIGKSYSTCDSVMDDFRALGAYVAPSSNRFDSHQSFNQQFHADIAVFFEHIASQVCFTTFDKVLIMDDGAELLLYAHQHIQDLGNFAGVEQTSSGFHKLNTIEVRFPIVNVARSQAKLMLESPFIAEAVIQNFDHYLTELDLHPTSILIAGSGYIGNNIYEQLKDRFTVQRYDIDKDKSDFDHTELDAMLPNFDVILSCAGTTVFLPDDYQYFKCGVILGSASSSDVEFSAVHLRQLAEPTSDVHADIRVPGPNGMIHLFNAGFPLNFDGSRQLIPLHKIQLTEALLYTALCLARTGVYPAGITDFDEEIQSILIEEFKQLIR
jgi:S-adenosylhomocysteine hydrolase